MKKAVIIVLMFIVLLIGICPIAAYADYSVGEDEVSSQIDDILSDYDIGYSYGDMSGLSFGEMAERIKENVSARLSAPVKVLGTLIIVVIFTAIMKSAGESVLSNSSTSGMYSMICVITAVTVISPQLFSVYSESLTAIERGGSFILVFVPVFSGITAATGGITAAGIYNLMILGASELIVELSEHFLLPVLSVTAVLAVTGSIFPSVSLNGISELLKKIITWGITIAMTLFTGFVTMKCTLGGKADSAAAKTIKTVISGAVPVVGGAVSDAYSTVLSGFDIIHATVGAAGTVAIVLIMLPPILELFIFRAVIWVGNTAAELFSADELVKLLKGIDSGLAIAQSVLVCYSMIFILCTGILMKCMT